MLMTLILVSAQIYEHSTSGLFLLIITILFFKITTGRKCPDVKKLEKPEDSR